MGRRIYGADFGATAKLAGELGIHHERHDQKVDTDDAEGAIYMDSAVDSREPVASRWQRADEAD